MPSAQQHRAVAWLVHLYTASGAVAAFLGVVAVAGSRYRDAFIWMLVSTAIDATDGLLARLARVKAVLPEFDGGRLDDIVDFLTFVFLPVLLLYHSGALPDGWGAGVASIVILSSAYGFGAADAKTDDHFFTGFPSYWNVVALYLYAGGLGPAANAVILLVLSALVFLRIGYVYPTRTRPLRSLTVLLALVWAAMLLAVIAALPHPSPRLLLVSLFFPIYYVALSLALDARRAVRP